MNQNDLAMLASDWASALPAAIVTVPPACVHLAEAYARSGEWAKLKQHAERASWRELDSLRSAWLARAHERLGEDEESAAAWKAALNDAQKHPELLERVAKLALDWRWEQRGQDALWRLANDERCPRWAIQTLWGASLKKGDSAQLCRLSRLMVRADPASVAARNNAVVLSLLTRSVETSTHEMAEALYREHPGDPVIVATYGLSLYERGRAAEALALMGALKPEQLRHPVVALYYGIFLTDAGQAEKAGEYLDIGAGGALLPEERSLLARAKANAEVIASSPKTSP
jgi:Flp pilus assembly protein TadD